MARAEADRPPKPGTSRQVRRRPRFLLFALIFLLVVGVLSIPLAWRELSVRSLAAESRRLIEAGRFDEARAPIGAWIEARPDSPEAAALMARALLGVGMVDLALPARRRAEALGYDGRADERQWALGLARAGRPALAEPILARLASPPSPPDPEVDEALAFYYMSTFQDREARKVLERWKADDPKAATPYLWIAELGLRADTSSQDLITAYEGALERDPKLAAARLGLAEQKIELHLADEARALFEAYLAEKPDDPRARLGLGQALAELGDEPGAIRELEHAARLAPEDVGVPLFRAKLALRDGKLEEALGFADRAVAIDPGEPKARFMRSTLLTRLGRKEEAEQERKITERLRAEDQEIRAIRRALAADPLNVDLRLKIARWLFDRDHPDEARAWVEAVVKDAPAHPEANRLLAKYHRDRGNAGLARFYALKAGDDPIAPAPAPSPDAEAQK